MSTPGVAPPILDDVRSAPPARPHILLNSELMPVRKSGT